MSSFEGETQWWDDPRLAEIGRALIETYPPHLPQSARSPGVLRPYGAFFAGDFERLHELMDETVESCRSHDRPWELAFSLQLRAKINTDVTERLSSSLADIEESRMLFQQLGDEWGTAETLSAEAEAASNGGDWERAVICCREGIELARKIGSHQHVPVLTVRWGEAMVNAGDPEGGVLLVRQGIEDAERFGSASHDASFYGKVLLAGILSRRGDIPGALELIDSTAAAARDGSTGVPGFILGMLHAMRGHLVGKSGDPEGGLRRMAEGVDELGRHPMANVITPRLAILLAPGAVELLAVLAARDADDERSPRRARRAATLLSAHERLRPSVMPPAERRDVENIEAQLRELLTDAGFEAAYAEGDATSVEEAVALMRDID
jgi:hypothetical protein